MDFSFETLFISTVITINVVYVNQNFCHFEDFFFFLSLYLFSFLICELLCPCFLSPFYYSGFLYKHMCLIFKWNMHYLSIKSLRNDLYTGCPKGKATTALSLWKFHQAISVCLTDPPSSLMAIGIFFSLKKVSKKVIFF